MSEKSEKPLLGSLDHVIVAVRDLGAAEQTLTALLGREPSWRGGHPGAGSANVLYRLENSYVELLAPEGEGPVAKLLTGHLDAHGDGPLGLAFGTDDAEAAHAVFEAHGLAPGPLQPMRGVERNTRVEREWANVLLPLERTRGVLLFAIEHRSPASRLLLAEVKGDASAAIAGLDHAVIRSADADATARLYGEGGLGLRLALDKRFPQWGARLMFFRVGGITVEIAAALEGAAAPGGGASNASAERDEFWGLSWRVPDVAAVRERLAAAGFDVSEVRKGRKPGTQVCTVRGEPCGVATLLLGPDPVAS